MRTPITLGYVEQQKLRSVVSRFFLSLLSFFRHISTGYPLLVSHILTNFNHTSIPLVTIRPNTIGITKHNTFDYYHCSYYKICFHPSIDRYRYLLHYTYTKIPNQSPPPPKKRKRRVIHILEKWCFVLRSK